MKYLNTLNPVLLKPIVRNERTCRYQEALDGWVDDLQKRYSSGAVSFFERSAGRDGTAPLCIAAFCWHSPLSRHHGDPALLAFFAAGLRYYTGSIQDDGLMATYGLNGDIWAHGWDVEGLVYGIVFCGQALPQDLLQQAMARLRLSAHRHANLAQTSGVIGSFGNQRCVWILGLHLYGQLLEQPELIDLADRFWADARPKVLDESGQVIEQMGPCMHYSYTGFFYAWLNLAIRNDTSEQVRLERCLEWFRCRHTESLYPIAGPSTRLYYETLPAVVGDLLPAAEQVAGSNPLPLEFVTRAIEEARRRHPAPSLPDTRGEFDCICGHGASPLMWAMLMAGGDLAPRPAVSPVLEPVTLEFKTTNLLKRSPLAYLLVRRDYQTHFNYTDFLPFSGIQTWALDGEPPIIHPTPLAPSTTQGDCLDTARQGVSHNWGLYGAGAIGIDAYSGKRDDHGRLDFVLARYHWLWRLAIFTDRSTVILEFGNGGPRRTLWTLNRVEPAEPVITGNVVTFGGRRACLHASPDILPRLTSLADKDPWATGVKQLRYDCGEAPAAFAFSDASFRFDTPPPGDASPWRFSDGAGRYEVILDERLFMPNPGNFRVDTFQLADGILARQA
jgi:hypothetical protein